MVEPPPHGPARRTVPLRRLLETEPCTPCTLSFSLQKQVSSGIPDHTPGNCVHPGHQLRTSRQLEGQYIAHLPPTQALQQEYCRCPLVREKSAGIHGSGFFCQELLASRETSDRSAGRLGRLVLAPTRRGPGEQHLSPTAKGVATMRQQAH